MITCMNQYDTYGGLSRVSHVAPIAQKSGQSPCTIVQGVSSKMTRREFFIFIILSDTYTCTYVV